MFRAFLGPQAPAWIGQLATIVTVLSAVVFGLVLLYLLTDVRRAHGRRMSAMPLDDQTGADDLGGERHHA
jgi:threonine/homoserine/homoserine lactone efflux protein